MKREEIFDITSLSLSLSLFFFSPFTTILYTLITTITSTPVLGNSDFNFGFLSSFLFPLTASVFLAVSPEIFHFSFFFHF